MKTGLVFGGQVTQGLDILDDMCYGAIASEHRKRISSQNWSLGYVVEGATDLESILTRDRGGIDVAGFGDALDSSWQMGESVGMSGLCH